MSISLVQKCYVFEDNYSVPMVMVTTGNRLLPVGWSFPRDQNCSPTHQHPFITLGQTGPQPINTTTPTSEPLTNHGPLTPQHLLQNHLRTTRGKKRVIYASAIYQQVQNNRWKNILLRMKLAHSRNYYSLYTVRLCASEVEVGPNRLMVRV